MTYFTQNMKLFNTKHDNNLYNIWKNYTKKQQKTYNELLNNIWLILQNIWLHARLHIIKN